jgi:hypothetical protein
MSDMATYEERLAEAEKRVGETRRAVKRQRALVEAHRRRITNARDVESLLDAFERSLRIFEDELASIRREKCK